MSIRLGVVAFVSVLFQTIVPAKAVDITVNFSNAETDFGTVNTSLLTLGSLYFQALGTTTSTFLVDIDSPGAKRSNSVSANSIESSSPRNLGLSFSLSGFEIFKEAAIKASAERSARIYVKNVTTEQYAAPLQILNAPELATDRALYQTFCPPASCRFLFVYHVTKVDEGGFGFGKKYSVGGKLAFPAVVKVSGFDANVAYENSSALNWTGKASPMFYKTLSMKLIAAADGSYRFIPDIQRKIARRAEN